MEKRKREQRHLVHDMVINRCHLQIASRDVKCQYLVGRWAFRVCGVGFQVEQDIN